MPEDLFAVEIAAPAKLNLWLHVLESMRSGYHAIESLFCAISLCDTIRVRPGAAGLRLTVSGADDLGPIEQNLVYRAAARYLDASGLPAALDIELLKRIPAAAGLGGGSSDAAAMLRALDRLYGSPLRPHELLQIGSELGSDVPFFLGDSPLALAWGRGERLLSLPPLPHRPVLVAHPGSAMPTPRAFARLAATRAVDHVPPASHVAVKELASWESVAERAANDFQPVAADHLPELGPALRILRDSGASPALLCGSGAAVFGVFSTESQRATATERIHALGFRSWLAETLLSFPLAQVDPSPRIG